MLQNSKSLAIAFAGRAAVASAQIYAAPQTQVYAPSTACCRKSVSTQKMARKFHSISLSRTSRPESNSPVLRQAGDPSARLLSVSVASATWF